MWLRNGAWYEQGEGMREEEATGDAAPIAEPRVVPLRPPPGPKGLDRLVWAYQTHVTAIYQYLYSRVGNRPDAEDLTSEVFVKAIRGMRRDASATELRAWLYRVAHTTLADYWRQFYAEGTTGLQDDLPELAAGGDNLEAVSRVEALLKGLPETYRRVLELRFLRGYTVREAARELGLTETNVKVLQFRALNRAGRELKKP